LVAPFRQPVTRAWSGSGAIGLDSAPVDPKSFVYSAVLLLVAAAAAVALFRRFGLGSILGLLVAGVLIGPHTPGPSVTSHVEDLRHFTELGVVLLLFVIGLEMHPSRLWDMRRTLFGLGSAQILVSAAALALYFRLYVDGWSLALLMGGSLALSSTALVMQLLYEQQDIASRRGQTAFSILLMQDLAVVPLMAMVPLLAEAGPLPAGEPLWEQVLVVAGLLGLVAFAGLVLVPKVLDWLAHQYNREAFFLTVMAAVFIAAWAMDRAGMSMALGAFLMGMLLSRSRYSVQIRASVEPHKGLLMSLFFVAVGMSVDLGVVIAQPLRFAQHLVVLLAIKISVLYLLCRWFGTGHGVAVRVGFLLGQAGEFGFVLFGAAKVLGIIGDEVFAMAVAVISLSMLVTPLLNKLGERIGRDGVEDVDERFRYTRAAGAEAEGPRVIIAGYGRVGHTVGTILSGQGIDYVAFDPDPALVARWRGDGYPVYYGDIRDPHLLEAAGIEGAELVVLTIDNPQAAVEATELVRAHSSRVGIVARARDLNACDALYRAGANHAFPEAVEASLKLAQETLEALGIAEDVAASTLTGVRNEDYAQVRSEIDPVHADPSPDSAGAQGRKSAGT
jgi:glutathione-regulated potassium-efflux system ancillary protein KefC